MNKDFEKWLKKEIVDNENFYQYYIDNPDQQEDIHKQYEIDTASKEQESWLEWSVRNPELAKREFPNMINDLEIRISNSEPYVTALIIQKIPEGFVKRKNEFDQQLGIKRKKLIQEYINLISYALNFRDNSPEIEREAVLNVQEELIEELEYWQEKLSEITIKQTKTINANNNRSESIKSSIDKWLYEFLENDTLDKVNYNLLSDSLIHYLDKNSFPHISTTIHIGRVNVKRIGWAINRILKEQGKGITIELLKFSKENISIYMKYDFNEEHFKNNNLYKYFTTKPQ